MWVGMVQYKTSDQYLTSGQVRILPSGGSGDIIQLLTTEVLDMP